MCMCHTHGLAMLTLASSPAVNGGVMGYSGSCWMGYEKIEIFDQYFVLSSKRYGHRYNQSINQSINQKRIKVTKVTNVTARPLMWTRLMKTNRKLYAICQMVPFFNDLEWPLTQISRTCSLYIYVHRARKAKIVHTFTSKTSMHWGWL